MTALDPIDRRLIAATDAGLPLDMRPYARIAEQLGLQECDVIARLAEMEASGIVRRTGPQPFQAPKTNDVLVAVVPHNIRSEERMPKINQRHYRNDGKKSQHGSLIDPSLGRPGIDLFKSDNGNSFMPLPATAARKKAPYCR